MKKLLALLVFSFGFLAFTRAQDAKTTEKKEGPTPKYARATFNSSRIINMQSTEIVSKGALEFMISHHFSPLWVKVDPNSFWGDKGINFRHNASQFFGLNSGIARTYLSFSYSPLTWLNAGFAWAGSDKYEGFAKFKLLRQQSGARNIPVSVSLYSMADVYTSENADVDFGANRWSYLNQLLIARKMTDKLSLELMPTWIHFNVVPYGINNSNDVFGLGIGAKYKVKPKMNVTFEYSHQLNMYKNIISKSGSILNYQPDLVSAGIEMNTGGHLFQFYIGTTTDGSLIDQMARNTNGGKLALGFCINRSLSIKK